MYYYKPVINNKVEVIYIKIILNLMGFRATGRVLDMSDFTVLKEVY